MPSTDIRNAVFAGAKLDEEVTGTGEFYTDRLGVKRLTNTGRNNQFDAAQLDRANRFEQFLLSSGYVFLGDYEDGPFQFSARNQYIRYNNQYYRLNAATDVGFTTTGTDATSFANDVTHFVLMDGDALRQNLGSSEEGLGANLVMTKMGWTVQAALYGRVPAYAFGVRADYDAETDTGTDNTDAISNALEWAASNNIREVYFPAGLILTKGGHSLGGTSSTTSGTRDTWDNVWEGTRLVGAGRYSTIFVFDPQNQDDYCFAALGGWGSHSPRGIFDCAIMPKTSYNYDEEAYGTAISLRGACFVPVDGVNIGRFHNGILFHNENAGDFTEFNRVTNTRIYRCDRDIAFISELGDNSFHGNEIDAMLQIREYGGVGIYAKDTQARGESESYYANLYNCTFNVKFFATHATNKGVCYATWLDNAIITKASGAMTCEGNATHHIESWEFISSTGSWVNTDTTTYEQADSTRTRRSITPTIQWQWSAGNNAGPSTYLDGGDAYLNSTNLRLQVPDYAVPRVLRVRGTTSASKNAEGLAFWNPAGDRLGYLFGTKSTDTSSMAGFRVKFYIDYSGSFIGTPAGSILGLGKVRISRSFLPKLTR
ncbi:hypothetical protein NL465_10040 [Klebsiella pneumoniae]|nr:hypothetical protein [Klebsiella pneumoniae]